MDAPAARRRAPAPAAGSVPGSAATPPGPAPASAAATPAAPVAQGRALGSSGVRLFRWEDLPRERVTDLLERRLITGERMMLAHVYLKKGCIVPAHSHENEQITYVLEGALRFWLGEDGREEVVVRSGEVLTIPSKVRHKAEALEDTLDVDVFAPPRQDWLAKTDDYLRSPVDDLFRER